MNLATFVLLLAVLAGCRSHVTHSAMSQMSLEQFNAPDGPWQRAMAARRYKLSAALLEDYIRRNEPALPEEERTLLHFHCVQAYALQGDYSNALAHVPAAKFHVEPSDWPLRWNAYVEATAAFLTRDLSRFESARREILEGPKVNGVAPNMLVIERLAAHWGASYEEAYIPAKP